MVQKASSYPEFLEVNKHIAHYLGIRLLHAGLLLMDYERLYGQEAVKSMARFVDWCKKNGKEEMIVPALAHDISEMYDECFNPRTAGY